MIWSRPKKSRFTTKESRSTVRQKMHTSCGLDTGLATCGHRIFLRERRCKLRQSILLIVFAMVRPRFRADRRVCKLWRSWKRLLAQFVPGVIQSACNIVKKLTTEFYNPAALMARTPKGIGSAVTVQPVIRELSYDLIQSARNDWFPLR